MNEDVILTISYIVITKFKIYRRQDYRRKYSCTYNTKVYFLSIFSTPFVLNYRLFSDFVFIFVVSRKI